jgi:hypothetical protein
VETTFTAPERPVAQESGVRLASQHFLDGGGPGNGPHLPYP